MCNMLCNSAEIVVLTRLLPYGVLVTGRKTYKEKNPFISDKCLTKLLNFVFVNLKALTWYTIDEFRRKAPQDNGPT